MDLVGEPVVHQTQRVDRKMRLRPLQNKRLVAGLFTLAVLCSVGLSTGLALTQRSWCDEAWFASPAYNLIHKGFLGTTLLDPHGFAFAPFVKGLERYTYWVPPAFILLEAAWFKIAGLGLTAMRSVSIFWSVVALGAWYAIARRLTGNIGTALLVTALLGIDRNFAQSASTARMDMMCAALEFLALALYLSFRERNYSRALWTANGAVAAAGLTHANCVLGIASLALLAFIFDRDKWSWKHLFQATAPYAIAGLLWLAYILRAPAIFLAQYQAQAKFPHRFEIPWNLIRAIHVELSWRWKQPFGLDRMFPGSLVSIIFFSYVIAAVAVVAIPSLRRNKGVMALWSLALLHCGFLLFLQKNWYYLIFAIPFLTGLVAVLLEWCWRQRRLTRWLAIGYACGALLLQAGATAVRIRHNTITHRYEPAIAFLREHLEPGDRVLGSGELAWALGFDGQAIDDARLGFSSHLHPRFIVVESQYGLFWFPWLKEEEPKSFAYVKNVLTNDYRLVYDQYRDDVPSRGFYDEPYQIYERLENPNADAR